MCDPLFSCVPHTSSLLTHHSIYAHGLLGVGSAPLAALDEPAVVILSPACQFIFKLTHAGGLLGVGSAPLAALDKAFVDFCFEQVCVCVCV